ncbi:hypothetical protein AX769_17030 [Frondihabitans sp. PAMC 28766]|uniref:3-keto-disaccharide hydrolase n=1 Tax=Frondihabitans sp. PAMC 28766 TaxID=1795630 RepID=UPI00078CF55E|nr:DUF1080 domain-containing protein [Frondihabitans sp. PAMC 28766]AMM21534.1 hypothetical protein AX769_17030 [Frondihabitans sp. PAMC 28766]
MSRALFDGHSLAGWHAVPRLPVPVAPGGVEPDHDSPRYRAAAATSGRWTVDDGAIVGGQEPPGGFGGYLVTDDVFADFELTLEVRPDWPADTGFLVRTTDIASQGLQVLVDHHKSGSIGGFYGNGVSGFHAIGHVLDVHRDADGRPNGLVEEDPATTLEPVTQAKIDLLSYRATASDFLDAWRWGDWNEIRLRCVGATPTLTSWVNGTKLYEVETATMSWPGYDADQVAALLGRAGHIALEVHDNDERMGDDRWAPGAVVRWRDLVVDEVLPEV